MGYEHSRDLNEIQKGMAMKLCYKLLAESSLWARFFRAKYNRREHFLMREVRNGDSRLWKYAMSMKNEVMTNIRIMLRKGNSSFWYDKWIGSVPLDYGVNPPHEHPRASELFHVVEGTLYAGFFLSNPGDPNQPHKLYAKVLQKGDVYVFPKGLIHFQYNLGGTNAVAVASFNSQNPGVVTLASLVFGSEPPVLPDVLVKSFQVDKKLVLYLQSLQWKGNN